MADFKPLGCVCLCVRVLDVHTYHKINVTVLILKILHQLLESLRLHAHLQSKQIPAAVITTINRCDSHPVSQQDASPKSFSCVLLLSAVGGDSLLMQK